MEERSKARFRATRERIGLSQKALADMLGNTVDIVKKWENPRYVAPPEDAWRLLDRMLDAHRKAVDAAVSIIHERAKEHDGRQPEEVRLLYWRSQAQYNAYGRDLGDYTVIDARAREVAVRLEMEGIRVTFQYPEDDEQTFQTLANTR